MPLPSPRWIAAALPLGLVLAGCSGEPSYDDRDWSALAPVAADVPQVRAPALATARANLAALDPCAIGAVGESGAIRTPAADGSCTVDRGRGSVEVSTTARYLVESTGLDAINALDSRERVDLAGVAAWAGPGPVTSGGDDVGCAVVVPASLDLALAITDADDDCATAKEVAAAALGDLGAVTRPGRTPAPPVFYAADEPTPGGEGGCAELGGQIAWLCAPVGDVDVPGDPVDLVRRGEADPGVLCVPALESARATAASKGRSWVAMTTATGPQDRAERASYDGRRQCTLVAAKDQEDVDGDPATIVVTARRDPLGTASNAKVGDHAAYHDARSGTWEVALTTTDEKGYLAVTVLDTRRKEPDWAKDLVADLVKRTLD